MPAFHCRTCRGYGEVLQFVESSLGPAVLVQRPVACPNCGGARTRQHRIEARRAASALIDGLMGFGEVAPLNPDDPDA